MFVPCFNCGQPMQDGLATITPYGLLHICSDQCLRTLNNADGHTPESVKRYNERQHQERDNGKQ